MTASCYFLSRIAKVYNLLNIYFLLLNPLEAIVVVVINTDVLVCIVEFDTVRFPWNLQSKGSILNEPPY
jgi:hypothetical protein